VTVQLGILIGAVTFTGSLVAFAKLQELMSGRPLTFPGQRTVNALLFLLIVALAARVIAAGPPADAPRRRR
jgi:NAD(P) transhydrogenase subunit beta